MRSQKEVVVEIDKEGNITVEGKGFVGPECGSFIKEIQDALGTTTASRDKEEYRQRARTTQREVQRGGR